MAARSGRFGRGDGVSPEERPPYLAMLVDPPLPLLALTRQGFRPRPRLAIAPSTKFLLGSTPPTPAGAAAAHSCRRSQMRGRKKGTDLSPSCVSRVRAYINSAPFPPANYITGSRG
ncbi:hypothetical protein BDA96_01G308700 [Sorghum bicolor]|uniref:Uncharacterized protein n=1 Tax=Sorghum bicolor TaxID=4558 RepID=A0A921V008_SORBI|nr:hypothetical protein BDA96_01G308700 [Sorghum bicolor]